MSSAQPSRSPSWRACSPRRPGRIWLADFLYWRSVIYLFRHGEVEMAETRRFIGHLDVPLSVQGERQGAAQGGRLSSVKLDGLFASDLVRARRTGELIGMPQGLVPGGKASPLPRSGGASPRSSPSGWR